MKHRNNVLVKGFRQSAPYLNAHRGKTFVIMLSGEAIQHKNFRSILSDFAVLNSLGIKIVLVYGTRPYIDAELTKVNRASSYYNGTRITDSDTLDIIKSVAGSLQLEITSQLSMGLNNTPMAGAQINVVSGNFVIAQPIGIYKGVDYLHSGKIRRINIEGIKRQLDQNTIVLLGPVGNSVTGECFNLSSEEVATQVAIRLGADKLIGYCADQGIVAENGKVIQELFPNEAQAILDNRQDEGDLHSETVRFLRSAIHACHAGVPRSHLVSYIEDGAIIQELFSIEGIGTQIVKDSAQQTRQATIADIGGILNLIRPLEEKGILVRRSRKQLEQEIDKFTIIAKDGLIIGCAALYVYPEEKMAEMACVAIHPDYRDADRGTVLFHHMRNEAKAKGIKQLFVLTTQTLHWFIEQGFKEISIEQLPRKKQKLYNYQRKSKPFALDL